MFCPRETLARINCFLEIPWKCWINEINKDDIRAKTGESFLEKHLTPQYKTDFVDDFGCICFH